MSFFIKLSAVLFFAGVLATPGRVQVDLSVTRTPWGGIRGSGGNGQSMSEQIEAELIRDPSILERLAEMGDGVDPCVQYCPDAIAQFSPSDVRFTLFNKDLPSGEDITESRGVGKLIPNSPIRFIIHGFMTGEVANMASILTANYLKQTLPHNIIVVNWTKGSTSWLSHYYQCLVDTGLVPKVGEAVAKLAEDLVDKSQVNYLYINLVGHGLGAHMAGVAAKKFAQDKRVRLPIIAALDPVLPRFGAKSPTERLTSEDAIYVEVVHTNPGKLGYEAPIGDSDFYPNYRKGSLQPQCDGSVCSHAAAFKLFARTLTDRFAFQAVKCETMEALKAGQCESDVRAFMGGADMKFGKQEGIFYFTSE